MGGFISKQVDASFKRQQEFMLEMNRVTLERQIQMQNQMRERMVATQLARTRELFAWIGSFYAVATVAMISGFRKTRKPGVLAPLLPLTFIVAYQYDLAYGTKMNRIRAEAENILMFERDMTDIATGLPTISSLDMGRQKQEEKAKYKGISAETENKLD